MEEKKPRAFDNYSTNKICNYLVLLKKMPSQEVLQEVLQEKFPEFIAGLHALQPSYEFDTKHHILDFKNSYYNGASLIQRDYPVRQKALVELLNIYFGALKESEIENKFFELARLAIEKNNPELFKELYERIMSQSKLMEEKLCSMIYTSNNEEMKQWFALYLSDEKSNSKQDSSQKEFAKIIWENRDAWANAIAKIDLTIIPDTASTLFKQLGSDSLDSGRKLFEEKYQQLSQAVLMLHPLLLPIVMKDIATKALQNKNPGAFRYVFDRSTDNMKQELITELQTKFEGKVEQWREYLPSTSREDMQKADTSPQPDEQTQEAKAQPSITEVVEKENPKMLPQAINTMSNQDIVQCLLHETDEGVRNLLSQGLKDRKLDAMLTYLDNSTVSPLIRASQDGNLEAVKKLISLKMFNLFERDSKGKNILHILPKAFLEKNKLKPKPKPDLSMLELRDCLTNIMQKMIDVFKECNDRGLILPLQEFSTIKVPENRHLQNIYSDALSKTEYREILPLIADASEALAGNKQRRVRTNCCHLPLPQRRVSRSNLLPMSHPMSSVNTPAPVPRIRMI